MDNNENKKIDQNNSEYLTLREQLQSLEDVLISWQEERKKEIERSEKRFRRFAVQLIIIVSGAVGVVWSAVEMLSWYYDRLQQENMAERYSAVAFEMYEYENNPDVALQMLENSLELDDNFETRYQKAYIKGMKAVQMLLNLDRPFNRQELNIAHQSLADAKFLLQLCPERPEGHILESQLYTALKEYDNAENSIKKALAATPDHAFAKVRYATLLYQRKKFSEAQKLISEVIKTSPDNKWARLWYGLILDAQKQKKAALEQFEKAIEIDPKFDTAVYNLGCCYLNSRPRQFDRARECFLRVLKINPAYKQAYYQLGMSYGYEDRYDVALTYMDKALAISNDYLTAHNWRALVLFEMKRFNEASQAYSAAINLDPRNDKLYVRRAASKAQLKEFDSAINDLNFALELNTKNLEAVMTLSNIYLETGNTDMALKKIDEVLKSAGEDKALAADLWSLRARIWAKKQNFAQAIKDQQNALKCFKSKHTLYDLALYQFRAAERKKALATLDVLNELEPKYPAAWKLRVMLLKKDNKADALKALEKYLELRPQDTKMQELKKILQRK